MTTSPLLRVVSYNLHSYGKSGADIQRGQHELLRFQWPDVILLQEIYVRHHRGADGPAEGQVVPWLPAPASSNGPANVH